jgi:hypothetical protein
MAFTSKFVAAALVLVTGQIAAAQAVPYAANGYGGPLSGGPPMSVPINSEPGAMFIDSGNGIPADGQMGTPILSPDGAMPQNAPVPGSYSAGPYPSSVGSFPVCDPWRPKWYFRGDAVWLTRDKPGDRNLTTSDDHFVLSTEAFHFPLEVGMRLTLGRYLTDCTSIEGGFYGANFWDQRQSTALFPSVSGSGPLSPYWGTGGGAFDTSAFSNSNQQTALWQSNFDSGELGIRHWIFPSTSLLFGFRYINVDDQLQLSAFNDASNHNAGDSAFYRTSTTNNLFGVQTGVEYSHELGTRWLFVSVEAKGGAFANAAQQQNVLFNTATTDSQRSASDVQFASVIDLSVGLTVLLGDHCTIRGGYSLLFLDGLALAPDQLDTNPTMSNSRNFIADNGSMTLQGPFVGTEVVW